MFLHFRHGLQNVFTVTFVEPHGEEKLTLPLLVMTLTVKETDCSAVTCWLEGETVIRAAPEAAATTVPVLAYDQSITVTMAEPFLGMETGLGVAPIEHG